MPATAAERDAAADHGARRGALRERLRGRGQFLAIWPALAVLLIASPFLAGGSLSHRALLTMVAFAGILAIAAIGQTLVIQQGGLDLSVPGSISLASVMVTQYTHAVARDGYDPFMGRFLTPVGRFVRQPVQQTRLDFLHGS